MSRISCKAIPESLTETGGCHPGGVPDIGLFPKGGGYPCDFGCALPSDAKSEVVRINTCTTPIRYLRWHRLGNGFLQGPIYLQRMEHGPDTRVLFNANCPVRNFEIGHYARYSDRSGLPIRFDDLNTDARDQWGIDADIAARRLYVLHEGVLTSGIPAFLVLWAQMPRYRLLGRVMGLPGIKQVAIATYDHVLAPAIYRWHLRRLKRQASRAKQP